MMKKDDNQVVDTNEDTIVDDTSENPSSLPQQTQPPAITKPEKKQPVNDADMTVTKRNGKTEAVSFDKILKRIKQMGQSAGVKINYTTLAMKVIDQLYDKISTTQIDELSAEQCASMVSIDPCYYTLASKIIMSNHHRNTPATFSKAMTMLYKYKDKHGKHHPLLAEDVYEIIHKNASVFDTVCGDCSRDYLIDYFGFKTLERSYLMKVNDRIVERPQYMWLRVSIGIHRDDINAAIETYNLMSKKYFTHATPTLFNSGTPHPQNSSCYLIGMENDSIEGIYNTLKDCALISKWSGGIGIHIHNVRSQGSHIRGTNGSSNGIVPMLKVFNNTAKYVDQGGGRRNGSIAVYLEPWHADVELFLEMRKNHGDEEMKARDLFYAIWMPDLFMERVKTGGKWTLMCPDECRGLSDVYGDAFVALYEKYESEGKGRKTINARELWFQILDAQMETGTPYIVYKDAANRKSNQQNIGTIKSSNLCSEIIEYSDGNETAVCNLASVALPAFVEFPDEHKNNENNIQITSFNHVKLHEVVRVITRNLNKIIDGNFYPTEKTKTSNLRHRPIGIGVQGLADVFMMMNIAFTSETAKQINREIFETIYHASLTESCELAKIHGSYETFAGSPASEGKLQFDLWGATVTNERYNWDEMKENIKKHGMRNSLLLAPMPTASTSQILGYNECFEPITSNIYSRRTLAGEFVIANKYLMKDMMDLGLWNEKIKNNIIANNGSIQHLEIIPEHIREKYKTVWEIPMRHLIDMSAERGIFICQSQSLNLWLEEPNYNTLTSMHFYSWSKGLKTGIYYLRRRPRHQAQQFTIEPEKQQNITTEEDDICELCSS